jgi:hypothetical protein
VQHVAAAFTLGADMLMTPFNIIGGMMYGQEVRIGMTRFRPLVVWENNKKRAVIDARALTLNNMCRNPKKTAFGLTQTAEEKMSGHLKFFISIMAWISTCVFPFSSPLASNGVFENRAEFVSWGCGKGYFFMHGQDVLVRVMIWGYGRAYAMVADVAFRINETCRGRCRKA